LATCAAICDTCIAIEHRVICRFSFRVVAVLQRLLSRMFDVIVVGGGPAGLSAALMLGRCRRRVLVCDLGQPRNRRSHALHGYLTRDGVAPAAFIDLGRVELTPYAVQLRRIGVTGSCWTDGRFRVTLADGQEE